MPKEKEPSGGNPAKKDEDMTPASRRKPVKTTFKGDQAKLLILMLKQVLNLVQGQRELQSVLFDIVIFPATADIIQKCIIQGRRYAEAVKEKGHKQGPPRLYVFGAILSWASETSESAKDTYTKYKGLSLESRNDIIRLCKCSKIFNAETRKLTLTFGCGAEALALRSILLPLIIALPEASHPIGKAPRGYMERELEEWLVSMA